MFPAQDADGRAFCYSNADIRPAEQSAEIFRFVKFWERLRGAHPKHLVLDSQLTTYANLARLDGMGIAFITLRRRAPKLMKEIVLLPRSAWKVIELDVPSRKHRTPRVHERPVRLAGRVFRQFFIADLGHDEPAIPLSNQHRVSAQALITRYAQRMLIENALSDGVRFFHINALCSAVGLTVDFDMALLAIASGLYRLLAQRMRGYADACARQIFRDLADMPAEVRITGQEVQACFHRRAGLPIIVASGLWEQPIRAPWRNGLALRLIT